MKKEGLFTLRKLILLLISILIFTISSQLIIAPSQDAACCTNPEVPFFCDDSYFDQDFPDINDCCFGDTTCASQYLKTGRLCDDPVLPSLSECTTGSVQGCCTDSCESGTQGSCQDPSSFEATSCDQSTACAEGCCVCSDDQLNQVYAVNFVTQSQCSDECTVRGFEPVPISIWDPQKKNNCRIGIQASGIPLRGTVKDLLGNFVEEATVVIQGYAQVQTDASGFYEVPDLQPNNYSIKVYKSGYLTHTTSVTLLITDTEKTLDLTLERAAFGVINGQVLDLTDPSKKVSNAVLTVSGLDTDEQYTTNSDGEYSMIFRLTSGTKSYTITASHPRFFPQTQTIDVAGGETQLDFNLDPKKEGFLTLEVKDSRTSLPIDGARVILSNGLQRSTRNGIVEFNRGQHDTDNLYEGDYNIFVSKTLYTSKSENFTLPPYNPITRTILLEQNNNLCHIPSTPQQGLFEEYITSGQCAVINKPYFCAQGNLLTGTNDIKFNQCAGPDNIARTPDDCCPANQICQDSGFCLPKDVECLSSCTTRGEFKCLAACEGAVAGCQFHSPQVRDACNGKLAGTILTGSEYGLQDGEQVTCCTGTPKTTTQEDCTNNQDDDEDNLEDCADPDCYQKSCDNDNNICIPDSNGKLGTCSPPICPSGLITSQNTGCECGSYTGQIAETGDYCCSLNKQQYIGQNAEHEYTTQSPCGSTACSSASGTCCLDKCRGTVPNRIQRAIQSATNAGASVCNTDLSNVLCCASCGVTSQYVCDYKELCPILAPGESPTKKKDVKCAVQCSALKNCVANDIIDNPLDNSPACICGTQTIELGTIESIGKYCCTTPDASTTYVSSSPQGCPGSPSRGKVTGKVSDTLGNFLFGASICITPTSCYAVSAVDGSYELRIPFNRDYTFYATKPGYKDDSQVVTKHQRVQVSQSQADLTNVNFVLEADVQACITPPLPTTINFTASHTPGDVKKIKLDWVAPSCSNIIGFSILRSQSSGSTKDFFIEPTKTQFIDDTVDYGAQYQYTIKVKYPGQDLTSNPEIATITVGDEECEGMYRNNKFVQFCDINPNGKLVAKKNCDSENKVSALAQDTWCDETNEICSGPTSAGLAVCKKLNECGVRKQDALPFGLYFKQDRCLGTDASGAVDYSNNCYFDYYKSQESNPSRIINPTTVDVCLSCPISKSSRMSCFNYRSRAACDQDTCNRGNCGWINSPYSELGLGYCYEENYTKDDNCNLCSPSNNLFFNTRCTQNVCGSLGSCFSADEETSCKTCAQASCSDLKTQDLCVENSNEIDIDATAKVTRGQDACSLGTCKWVNNAVGCIKDANDDDANDCTNEELKKIELDLQRSTNDCLKDNTPPSTRLTSPAGLDSIGGSDVTLTFSVGSLDRNAHKFYYCFDTQDSCYPGTSGRSGGEILYTSSNQAILTRAGIKSRLETAGYNNTAIYYLRFFSTDKFYNQEDVQSIPLYIDVWPPSLSEKSRTLDIGFEGSGKDAKSKIIFDLASTEEANCVIQDFKRTGLGQILARVEIPKIINNKPHFGTSFTSEYTLKDGLYRYKLECRDIMGNIGRLNIEDIHIDAFRKVTVKKPITPNNIFNTHIIDFEVHTEDPSECKLIRVPSATLVSGGTFIPDTTALNHKLDDFSISLLSSGSQGSAHYPDLANSGYGIKCTETTSQADDLESFSFTIDRSPPNVTLTITEPSRAQKTHKNPGFSESYGDSVALTISCEDLTIDGSSQIFGADQNSKKLCKTTLGSTCNNFDSASSSIVLENTASICYTCSDKGGNEAPAECGDIIIDRDPPQFNLFVFDQNDDVLQLLVRQVPAKLYTIRLTSSEPLKDEEAILSFKIYRNTLLEQIFYPISLRLSRATTQPNPLQVSYETKFAIPLAEEFNNLDILDNVELTVTGKDVFNNPAIISKNYSIDTTAPEPPILYEIEGSTKVVRNSQQLYTQTGSEADKIANRQITIQRGNRPNLKKPSTINVRGIDINNKLDPLTIPVSVQQNEHLTTSKPNPKLLAEVPLDTVLDGNTINLRSLPASLTPKDLYLDFPNIKLPTREYYKILNQLPATDLQLTQKLQNLHSLRSSSATEKNFLRLDKPLHGLTRFDNISLSEQDKYTPNQQISIYEQPYPRGWFDVEMPLAEGSTWFYAYAVDENDNIGQPTSVKKVIIDSKPPTASYFEPAHNSIIRGNTGFTVLATFFDPNSGIDSNTAILQINDDSYTCLDSGIDCVGTKTFSITISQFFLPGKYDVTATVFDKAGNKKEQLWTFFVNNRAPSQVDVTTQNGLCIENDQCYVSTTLPNFTAKYKSLPNSQISSVFNSDPTNAVISKSLNSITLTPEFDLTHKNHILDITHDINGTLFPNFIKFVIDQQDPSIQIDSIAPTSSSAINLTGIYTEENVYEIRFTGDILPALPLTFRELPTDLINGNTFLFIKNLELDISNTTKKEKEIIITIVDKSNRSTQMSIKVFYDVNPPDLVNVTVTPFAQSRKMFEFNSSFFKTNDVKVKISGKSTKALSSMVLSTEYITKPVSVTKSVDGLFDFEVDLDLQNTLSTTKEEAVILQAQDFAGNTQYYILLIELDITAPKAEVKII